MITLKVYGVFKHCCDGKKVHEVDNCRTLKQALNYLVINFSKLRKYIYKTSKYLVGIYYNGKNITEEEARALVLFKGDSVSIIPHIYGAGRVGTIVVAVILIVVGAILWEFGGVALIEYGIDIFVADLGVSLMYAGAAMLLSGLAIPASGGPESYENSKFAEGNLKSSYGFGNTVDNLTKQGNSVPLGYGRMRVGSQVISAGVFAGNI